jgi:hypothetical protein
VHAATAGGQSHIDQDTVIRPRGTAGCSGGDPAVFVPWADVEQIVTYPRPGYPAGGPAPCIGIQRRQSAPDLSEGNEPAPSCPAPRVAAGTARPITGWRLDRDRLAAVTTAVAPGIPIIDTNTGPNPSVEGPAAG